MGILTQYNLSCDKCAWWEEGGTAYRSQIKKMRAVLKQLGWARIRENGKLIDLCPACNEKRKSGEDEQEK